MIFCPTLVSRLAQEDDNANFTAIWVFTPSENSFKVYQNFSISGDSPADFRVRSPPDIGYEVYSSSMLREGEKAPQNM